MKKNAGIVTLIFILLMAVLATLILIVGQSRLLLAIQRTRSSADSIITTYSAESQINDLLLRLSKGYLTSDDFNQFPTTITLDNGALRLEIDGEIDGTNQILTVTSSRSFAVSKIQAVRSTVTAGEITPVELILSLDCTQSMNNPSGGGNTSRMTEQKKAAINFIEKMKDHPNGDFISVGLVVFGTDAAWVKTQGGVDIKPQNGINFDTIISTIDTRFGDTKGSSSACDSVMDYTSIGSPYVFSQEYFAQSPLTSHKKVEVVITDGEPNTRISYPACPPDISCRPCSGEEAYNFLRCAITDTESRWSAINFGIRNPNIAAYGVTVLNPASDKIRTLFEETIGASNYFNATTADQLQGILEAIFDDVISSLSKTIITRVVPQPE